MGLYRAFIQQPASVTQFPNNATVTDAVLSTTSTVVLSARPNNRRGLIIENDGTVPMVFAYGSSVSVAARTFLLNPNDGFSDDVSWQGPIAAMSVGGAGAANFTEIVII